MDQGEKSQIGRGLERIDRRVKDRQARVTAALAEHCPDFPVDLIRKTFGARLESLRSPTMDYGPEIEPGIVPAEPWIIPKPPKGDYPAVVVPMSPAKRAYLRRAGRLRRTRPASKLKTYEHQRAHHPDS